MAKHHPDLIMCRKQPGIAIGRLCETCDGKCVVCDSYVRPHRRRYKQGESDAALGRRRRANRQESDSPTNAAIAVL
jgi:hypothetical protein